MVPMNPAARRCHPWIYRLLVECRVCAFWLMGGVSLAGWTAKAKQTAKPPSDTGNSLVRIHSLHAHTYIETKLNPFARQQSVGSELPNPSRRAAPSAANQRGGLTLASSRRLWLQTASAQSCGAALHSQTPKKYTRLRDREDP